MKKNSTSLKIAILALACFSIAYFAATMALAQNAANADAIAVRVVNNTGHKDVVNWYKDQGNKGTPQLTVVDGYKAIRDGRTAYVGVANVIDNDHDGALSAGDFFYTNIFVIAYTQSGSEETINSIFTQVLAYWKFNTNIGGNGFCRNLQGVSTSTCAIDKNCQKGDFCDSDKAQASRDTQRLADLEAMNRLLRAYRKANGNACPVFQAGSYIGNRTTSVWPSWQQTLGAELGSVLPTDPVNKMADCAVSSSSAKTGSQYAAVVPSCSTGVSGSFVYSACNASWSYDLNASVDGDYTVFAETSNMNLGINGEDLSQLPLYQSNGCAPGKTGLTHRLNVYVDNEPQPRATICNPATGPLASRQLGKAEIGALSRGVHRIRFDWTNDFTYTPPGATTYHDSNIRLYQVGITEGSYDPTTCFSEKYRRFAVPTPANQLKMNLPKNSLVYTYSSSRDGQNCGFFVTTESGLECDQNGRCWATDDSVLSDLTPSDDPFTPTGTTTPEIGCTLVSRTGLPLNGSNGTKNTVVIRSFNGSVIDRASAITMELVPLGPWSGWSAGDPRLSIISGLGTSKVTAVVKASTTGVMTIGGTAPAVRISVTDNIGNTSQKICPIQTKASCGDGFKEGAEGCDAGAANGQPGGNCSRTCVPCTDRDGDGYGDVTGHYGHFYGCRYDAPDCDDNPLAHDVAGKFGIVSFTGANLNPSQPDDCTQFDGIDNNCDGTADEGAKLNIMIGTQTQDFENTTAPSVPPGWLAGDQAHSRIEVSSAENVTPGGHNSLLFQQDADVPWAPCSKAFCEHPNYINRSFCTWDEANRQCHFSSGDYCNTGPFTLNEGQWGCWGISYNTSTWGYVQYSLHNYPFNLNDTYLLTFNYKGTSYFNSSFRSALAGFIGFDSQCYQQSSLPLLRCQDYPYGAYVYNSNPADLSGSQRCWDHYVTGSPTMPDPQKCVCMIHYKSAAHQRACYGGVYPGGVPEGTFDDWRLFSKIFKYDSSLQQIKDDAGLPALVFATTIGYNQTSQENKLYIDDLNLFQCSNLP